MQVYIFVYKKANTSANKIANKFNIDELFAIKKICCIQIMIFFVFNDIPKKSKY